MFGSKSLVAKLGNRRVIPFQDLEREYLATQADLEPALLKVLASGKYILGKETEEFEEQWSNYCGAAGAVLVGSGTDALTIALGASGLIRPGSGDEVVTAALGSSFTALEGGKDDPGNSCAPGLLAGFGVTVRACTTS